MTVYKYPSVLTIAGSDSGGGAGIQADLKTFSALGCYGTSAITAITVQNTMGVSGIHSIPEDIVSRQIIAVMDDIKPAAIKIGMVHSAEMAVSISETLAKYKYTPVIFDPVMVATSGDKLIKEDTVSVLKRVLFPLMTLITPNLDEAEILTGQSITSVQEMQKAAKALLQSNCGAVLLKGGHLKGEKLYDVYINSNGDELIFESDYIDSENVHGTGCTLSSAIAAYLALGNDLPLAIEKARIYVHDAILFGKDVKTGQGHGPLNHFFNPQKLELHEMV
ncbi:bifunctional hydroxymethylpyrimidine kinase/phosphomethylpyrimidine kinase [Pedobacter sp. MC2016-15]|uniref:bifunctional hydroxymethylpyrimidine kinase/phosphomethylpyrimidine kinase n=1 Tax=Pedobacter sp. MC2016-15 TaxID=2994473 RepID=UPI0022478C9B|nr:bifunctional hydroxymethylpyrimidine kinase/phosphomethylpyrimidine kinase [Pedobacter sp. MC2016-15]MCX2479772.1 bifunctional hydroxymethylpyrimidine kinase/phosphomethylpyrimidine kinase [Pedobacter sp. MC2016-15]